MNMIVLLLSFVAFLPIYAFIGTLLIIFSIFRCCIGIILSLKSGRKTDFLCGSESLYQIYRGKNTPIADFAFILHGEIDLNWIQDRISKTLLSDTRSYGNFFKYVKHWCGYFYWEKEENFKVSNHVLRLECNPPTNDRDLDEIVTKLITETHQEPGKSPWKIYVFPIAEGFRGISTGNNYIIQAIYHHCLTDGWGYIKFFENTFYQSLGPEIVPETTKSSIFQKFLHCVDIAMHIPASFYNQMLLNDANILCGYSQVGVQFRSTSSLVPLSRIKRIKNATGSTINEVMTSCLVGGIKRHFQRENVPLPDKLHCAIPVSSRTPEDLIFANLTSVRVLRFPFERVSPLDRLKTITKTTNDLKNSYDEVLLKYLQKIVFNRLPQCLTQPMLRNIRISLYLTNMAVSNTPSFQQCKMCRFKAHPPVGGNIGIGFAVLSNNDEIYYSAAADKSVIPNSKILDRLLSDCIDEIDLIERYC